MINIFSKSAAPSHGHVVKVKVSNWWLGFEPISKRMLFEMTKRERVCQILEFFYFILKQYLSNDTILRSVKHYVCHRGGVSYLWICCAVREELILLRDRRKCVCLMSEASMFPSSNAKRAAWGKKQKQNKQIFSVISNLSAKKGFYILQV